MNQFSSCSSNEAHCKDFDVAGNPISSLGWPASGIHNSKEPHLVAASVLHCIPWMLWPINGWNWPDAISNLPTRGISVATGYHRSKGILERKWGRHQF